LSLSELSHPADAKKRIVQVAPARTQKALTVGDPNASSCFSHVAYVVRDVESASQWEAGKTQFELIEPEPGHFLNDFVKDRGPRVQHVGFQNARLRLYRLNRRRGELYLKALLVRHAEPTARRAARSKYLRERSFWSRAFRRWGIRHIAARDASTSLSMTERKARGGHNQAERHTGLRRPY
jgi:hypothetical protein